MGQTIATSAARIRMPIIVLTAAAAAFLALGATPPAAHAASVTATEQGPGDPWDTPPADDGDPWDAPPADDGDPWDSAPADPGTVRGYGDPWD